MDLEVVTSSDRPDLDDRAAAAFRQRWPEFVFHDTRAQVHLERVSRYFAPYDVLLLAGDDVVAGGWGVAMALDGIPDLPGGYDDCLARAVVDHEAGSTPTALAVMAAAVNPDFAGRGLAAEVLSALIDRARAGGLDAVFAPLRPTWKERYPLVSMAEYATWVRADGLSIDPWIRAHQRMGARILGPAPDSMVIEGSVADWEDWAAMPFPVTGDYVVPGALNLVHVDREADVGRYREENLWVQHL